MRFLLAIPAAALLSACAAVKLPAIPPPVDATPAAGSQPAPTAWYQPFRIDGSWEEKRLGLGALKATYPFTDDTVEYKGDYYPKTGSTTTIKGKIKPLTGNLQAVYFTAQIGYYGFGWGDIKFDVPGGSTYLKVLGLYEGVRVPITVVDFKGPDIQLLLVPGFTAQVFYGSNSAPTSKLTGLMIGGSLNGVGLGVSVGDWLVLEADFWKWGWTYFDMTRDYTNGDTAMFSFSDFAYGWAPVFYARAKF